MNPIGKFYPEVSRKFIAFLALILILSGCGNSKDDLYRTLSKGDSGAKQYAGHYKVGGAYTINKKTYRPKKEHKYDETGMCSWYGQKKFHGKKTANGDLYNKNMLTAAHRTLPLPSLVKVTNLKNNKSLVVMINDRGPFRKDRMMDISEEGARILGFKDQGVAKIRAQYLLYESKELLAKLDIKDTSGSKAKGKIKNPKCSVNCHVKLVNIKHNLDIVARK